MLHGTLSNKLYVVTLAMCLQFQVNKMSIWLTAHTAKCNASYRLLGYKIGDDYTHLIAARLPPLPGDFLVRQNNHVAARAGSEIADDRGFYIDAGFYAVIVNSV